MFSRTIQRAFVLALIGLSSTACVSRGFPTHGGGKRFFREQELISVAIDRAVADLELDRITDQEVRADNPANPSESPAGLKNGIGLAIFSVADSGGGRRSSGGGPSIGNLFGILGSDAMDATSAATGNELLSKAQTDYSSFGFTSSADLDYLKGKIVQRILGAKIRFNPNPVTEEGKSVLNTGAIVVTVGEIGIDESSFNALVCSSNRLVARVQLNAWYVRQGASGAPIVTPLLKDSVAGTTHQGRYAEWYVLGIGPVNKTTPQFVPIEGRNTNE